LKNPNAKKLLVVDGSSYLFRAYHALPPLTNSKGLPTGAIYGVVNMLRKLLVDEKPDYCAVTFDTKSKNFRHTLYPEYKANRPPMADDLQVQIEPLHNIIRAMGLPLIAIEGIEADDIIGTLAHWGTGAGMQTVISTGDKDMAQLVNENVTLVNTMSSTVLNVDNVFTKFGVRPDQIVDYLALMGDPVDNVPGIPKVGPKTAAGWLATYGTVENIIAHANDIKGKVGEYLRAHLETLAIGKKLVTIQCDMPLPITLEELIPAPRDQNAIKALFEELEFKTWLRDLDKEQVGIEPIATTLAKPAQYEIICQEDQFLTWLDQLGKQKAFVIDVQTSNQDPMVAELVGLSFAYQTGVAGYVPLQHSSLGCPTQLSREWVLEKLKPLLESEIVGKIGHNLKFDMHVLGRYGIVLQHIVDDTMLTSYALNSTATKHNMDSLAKVYLQYKAIAYEEVAGKGAKAISFDQVAVESAGAYAAENADLNWRLHEVLADKIAAEPTLLSVYREIELPLIAVLLKMEQTGVCVDVAMLQKQSEQMQIQIQSLEQQATILAGEEFNLGSPKQLQEIFYGKLDFPVLERTPTGAPSTGESVLQTLSQNFELPKLILTHRSLSKLKSTYTDKLPGQINPTTGRVHTSYQQAVTATGRLSSIEPNLQNIPIRTEEGRKIRQAFIAPEGAVIMSADYSQIELRIMAHLSQDEGLISAFRQGLDIHRATASEIFNVPLDEVTDDQRRGAKAINFGLIYGMSTFGLSKQLDINRSSAQDYMDQYFARYPKVKTYMEATRVHAADQGYVETIFGRRLYLPDIRAKHMGKRRAAERAAINAPMQGTAADIIKKAMIAIHAQLPSHPDVKMLMQVHDELVFEIQANEVERAKQWIRDAMQNTVQLSVPLVVDIGVGKNWDEAH
jgi:DNA polymerase-1